METYLRPAMEDLSAVQEIGQTAYSQYVFGIGREPGAMLDDYEPRLRIAECASLRMSGGFRA